MIKTGNKFSENIYTDLNNVPQSSSIRGGCKEHGSCLNASHLNET